MLEKRGGLALVRVYTIQTQNHPDSSTRNRSSFLVRFKS